MERPWWTYGLWIVAAGAIGLIVSALFSSDLHLSRHGFLVPYVVMVGACLFGYARWSGINVGEHLHHRWMVGIIDACVVSVIMVVGVVQQPASSRPHGLALVWALVWIGGVYGALDALLLAVMPVLAIQQMFARLGRQPRWFRTFIAAMVALVASIFVTAAYHWGYTEFRGPALMQPIIGNTILTVGYLLTMNPTTPVVAHIAMHVAAILHGMETTVQLPPHQ